MSPSPPDRIGLQESVTCEREGHGPDVTEAGGEVGMLERAWDRLSQPRFRAVRVNPMLSPFQGSGIWNPVMLGWYVSHHWCR